MAVLGEGIDDAYVGIDQRIGGVDDAERHLSPRDEHHGAAHVVGTYQPVLDLVPGTQGDESGARVPPGGDRVRVAGREPPFAECA